MPDPARMTPEQLERALGYRHNFARIVRADEQRLEFGYDLDPQRWPWLALPPQHPVVLDKVQYFSAVTGSLAASRLEPGTRSALTKLGWSCTPRPGGARHAVRGVLEPWVGEQRAGYELTLFDDQGRENARIRGEGAAFADRDFAAWRAKSKREAAAAAAAQQVLPRADPVAAGLGPAGRSLVSAPLARDGARGVLAQVGAANGFHPAHPFHTGTGDHVNAAHLLDCALQAAHLLWDPAGTALRCTGGEAEFLRFVELEAAFELWLEACEPRAAGRARLRFAIGQAGRENARIRLELEATPPAPVESANLGGTDP